MAVLNLYPTISSHTFLIVLWRSFIAFISSFVLFFHSTTIEYALSRNLRTPMIASGFHGAVSVKADILIS